MSNPPKFTIDLIGKPGSFDDENTLKAIFKLLQNSPFGPVEIMDLKSEYDFSDKIDWTRIYDQIKGGLEVSAQFRGNKPFPYIGSIYKGSHNTSIYFLVARDQITPGKPKEIMEFAQKLLSIWPGFSHGSACGHHSIKDINRPTKIANLVNMWMGMNWVHILSREEYNRFYEKQDLITGPFYSTSEDENGNLYLYNYEDPLKYEDPDVLNKLVEISQYIKSKTIFNKQ